MDGLERARLCARIAYEKKASGIEIYDLRGLSDVADFFVLCTVQSRVQAKAVAGEIEQRLKALGDTKLGREGEGDSQWVLLDFVDVVVHIFSPTLREYYSIESLWGDAERVPWEPAPAADARSGAAARQGGASL